MNAVVLLDAVRAERHSNRGREARWITRQKLSNYRSCGEQRIVYDNVFLVVSVHFCHGWGIKMAC